ncbi:uncharacterized protein LOC134854737 [Symsagittifera roscoffensis]|uniref:uncharacterized protein LOC134854737 n=1 Tax=Symsagittifera roscoffensis TaxID=84072 RepID=UPI00307C09A4
MRFEKRRQREDETIDKFLDDLKMPIGRSQPDESNRRMNLAVASKFIDGMKNDELRTMLATHYTPLSTTAPTPEELRLKSKEYLLLKPPSRSGYYKTNYGNFNNGPANQGNNWYKPRTYVTTDSDKMGQIYLGQEELKVCRIGHDPMMEHDAVHIGYKADVTAHLLDKTGRKTESQGFWTQERKNGVMPDPQAVEAVLIWKAPRTDTQLMSFLGFANYYREFIKGYAYKVYPMQKLMRNKEKKFEWNDEAQAAFEIIKRELCERPVVGMPTEKGKWTVRLDDYYMIIEHRMRDKHQNADNLSKKTKFYARLE